MRMTTLVSVATLATVLAVVAAAGLHAQGRATVRVFVTGGAVWDTTGTLNPSAGASETADATAREFTQRCAGIRVTRRVERAHFVIQTGTTAADGTTERAVDTALGRLRTNRGRTGRAVREADGLVSGLFGRGRPENNLSLFDAWGDMLSTTSDRRLGNAVETLCEVMMEEVASGTESTTVGEANR